MIPEGRLNQTVVRVRPVTTTDSHGATVYDYGAGADRVTLAPGTSTGGVWLQQDQRSENRMDGRTSAEQLWLLISNYDDIAESDRIEWADHPAGSVVFDVEGPPEPTYALWGAFHHLEATLRITTG